MQPLWIHYIAYNCFLTLTMVYLTCDTPTTSMSIHDTVSRSQLLQYTSPIQTIEPKTNNAHYNTCSRFSNDSNIPRRLPKTSAIYYGSCHSHILLSVPFLKHTQRVWNISRKDWSHRHTLQLILATITLKRYHEVWCSILDTRHHNVPPLTPPHPLSIHSMY